MLPARIPDGHSHCRSRESLLLDDNLSIAEIALRDGL